MTTSKIEPLFGTPTAITITLDSLANGSGRAGAIVDNTTTRAGRAEILVTVQSNASIPTANTSVDVYLIRFDAGSSPSFGDDGATGSDAAWTRTSATYLGSVSCGGSPAANTNYAASFMAYDLGPGWTIGVVNNFGQALHAATSNNSVKYITHIDEAQ